MLTEEGKAHLERMVAFSGRQIAKDVKNSACRLEGDRAWFEYMHGQCLQDLLLRDQKEGDRQALIQHLTPLREMFYQAGEEALAPADDSFSEIFGPIRCTVPLHWVEEGNADIVANNLFLQDGRYTIIDYEWHMPCRVPAEFMIWRMLDHLAKETSLGAWLDEQWICDFVGVSKREIQGFVLWDRAFAEGYTGFQHLTELSKPSIPVDLDDAIAKWIQQYTVTSTLFVDTGKGITGEVYCQQNARYTPDGFEVRFDHEALRKAHALRWDPGEGDACKVRILGIDAGNVPMKATPINAEPERDDQGSDVFYTSDPQYSLHFDSPLTAGVTIRFTYNPIEWTIGYAEKERQLHACREKHQQLEENLRQMEGSTSWRLTKPLRHITTALKKRRG